MADAYTYTCFVCKDVYKVEGVAPALEEDECLLCPKCSEVVQKFSGTLPDGV